MRKFYLLLLTVLFAAITNAQTFAVKEVEPNNTAGTATPITTNPAKISGNVYPNADADMYSFSAVAGDKVYATVASVFSSTASTDAQLRLFASDGTTLIEFDEDDGAAGTVGGLSSGIAGATIPTTGTYYLEVKHFSATTQLRGYDLYLKVQTGAPTPEVEANDLSSTANVLPASGWVSGARNPAAGTEQDWFSLSLTAGQTIFISMDLDPERDNVQYNGRLGFALFGDASNLILVSDDASTGSVANPLSETFIYTVKNTGTYYVFADATLAATGGPTATYNISVATFAAATGYVNYPSTDIPKILGPATGATTSTLTIADNKLIRDLSVRITLDHTLMADLDATLTSPNGEVIHLFSDIGSTAIAGQTQMDLVFNDNNATSASSAFTTLRPVALQPELLSKLDLFKGIKTAGVWTLTVYDDLAANGGNLTNWSLDILEETGPNLTGFTAIVNEDFETSNGGFASSGTANEWEYGTPATVATTTVAAFSNANSGTKCWKTDLDNSYDATSNQLLESPTYDLTPIVGTIHLSFAMKHQVEQLAFDQLEVYMEEVGGGGAIQKLFTWYGATPTTTIGSGVSLGLSSGWGTHFADISSFAGKQVKFKVRLVTDNSVQLAGVAIDDIKIYAVVSCVITCPANITVSNDANQCGAVVNYPAPMTSGTCGTVTGSPASGSFFPVGTTTVTVTSSVGGGTCSFTVTVNDTQLPVITCPANISQNATTGQCAAVVNYSAPLASDNCPGVTVTRIAGPASGSSFPVGVTTVTYRATDAAGNFTTCTFTVTVVDNQPPVITCPSTITVGSDAGLCSAVVNFTVGSTDNCASASLTQSTSNTVAPGSVSCNAGGLHTENSYWRAYQLSLPSAVAVNSVTFGIETANAAGTGTTQPVNVRVYTSAGAFPGGVRTQVASQTFNIPDQTGTLFTASFTTPPTVPGNAILVLEVNTPSGQAAGHSFFIGSNSAGQSAPGYLSAADCGITTPTTTAVIGFPNMHIILNASVSGSVPVVSVPASGSIFPVGTTVVTSTATDAAGNIATCQFNVIVNDTQAPTVSCPANVTRTTDAGVCTATFAPANPTGADNCGVTIQTWALTGATTGTSPATGINTVGSRAFNLGVTTVTYTVRDAAGNTGSCSFTVTITDAVLPTIGTQPANRTVCTGTAASFTVVATTAPTAGGPLSYQWQQWNGTAWVNITGATAATYTVANPVQSMNTNTFRVNVTGLCTTVASTAATLFVNPLPTISLTSSNAAVLLPGQTTSIVANVNPTGGTFAWLKNGAPRVPTVTTGTLSNLTVDDAGTYRATYTDLNGCVATSGDLVISAEVSDRFFVAPNPNFGQFWVRYYNQTGEALTVIVFDSKGRRVHQQQSATTLAYTRIDVDMGVQAAGVYVVELRGTGGRLLGRKQIIVAAK